MNIIHLQYFVTLAKVKNFTQAAESLYITQPSLSQSISRLEKELNTSLFKRSTVKVELTYTGQLFLKTAQDILSLYEDVTNRISNVEDLTIGALSAGFPYAYSNLVLPPVMQTFAQRYPNVKLSVNEGRSSSLMEKFIEKKLDLIILDSDSLKGLSNPHEYVCDRIIADDPLVFVVPKTHPLCRKNISLPQTPYNLPTLDVNDLEGTPFIVLQSSHRMRKKINIIFDDKKFTPNIILEVNQLEASLYNAVYGKAVTIVPFSIFSHFRDDSKGYAFVERNYTFPSDYYCVYSMNSPSFVAAREFSKTAKEILLR